MKVATSLFFLLTALVAGGVGCGRGESAEDRQMAAMREEIDRVAEARDRDEAPIDSDETKGGDGAKAAPPGPKAPAPRFDPPNQGGEETADTQVQDQPTSDDPEDATPRPNIRVTGVPGRPTRRMGGAGPYGGDDQVQASGLDDSSAGSRSSATDPEARRAYESALGQAQGGHYAQALDQFAAFLVKWPDHPYAENATFWRGESYFMMGDYPHALEQFEGVLARFQTGNKVPDALLKAGMCEQKLGNPQKARSYFDRLAREYPKSDAARRIPTENK